MVPVNTLTDNRKVELISVIALAHYNKYTNNVETFFSDQGKRLLSNYRKYISEIENRTISKQANDIELITMENLLRLKIKEANEDNEKIKGEAIALTEYDKGFFGYTDMLMSIYNDLTNSKFVSKEMKTYIKKAVGFWRAFENWVVKGAR